MRMPLLIFCIIMVFALPAQAVTRIDITRGTVRAIPIALSEFSAATEDASLAGEMLQVIGTNLESSGLFTPIDPAAFIDTTRGAETRPDFKNWRVINAEALMMGSIKPVGADKIQVDIRLWDVLAQRQVAGKSFTAARESWRRMGHLVADEIYTRLTGESGYFDSRIVHIAESGHWKKPIKRLAIMDQDGANYKYLTSGKHLVLTPRFDPAQQRIIYLGYYGGAPSVYLYDLEHGTEELLGKFPGMSFAPRFSPDGRKVVMSVSRNGNSDIYAMDIATRRTRQLTRHTAIDTSPSFAPDGKKIVFNSDRGGSQQIYVMDAEDGDVQRISFGKGSYATPVWSPRGDWVAFTRMWKGKFYIGVMRPDGSGERLLTESYLDEGPTWSPNGRVIMFMRQTPSWKGKPGKSSLYSIDVTGHNLRRIRTPGNASDPAWSPLLGR